MYIQFLGPQFTQVTLYTQRSVLVSFPDTTFSQGKHSGLPNFWASTHLGNLADFVTHPLKNIGIPNCSKYTLTLTCSRARGMLHNHEMLTTYHPDENSMVLHIVDIIRTASMECIISSKMWNFGSTYTPSWGVVILTYHHPNTSVQECSQSNLLSTVEERCEQHSYVLPRLWFI